MSYEAVPILLSLLVLLGGALAIHWLEKQRDCDE
jgi:hypothetical protein